MSMTMIVTKVQQKTENRYIAENSILSTICYLFTVACAHLLIGTPDPKFNNLRENKLTKGAQILKKLVEKIQQMKQHKKDLLHN